MQKMALSVPELAQALGVGRNIAYELAQRADFPAVRIGERRIVVPVDKLKEWLERQGKAQVSSENQ
jgi:excisionase family DNA binding protein